MGKRSLWLVGVAAVAAALWMAPPAHAWFLPGSPGGAIVQVGIEDVSEWYVVDMDDDPVDTDLRWEMRSAFDVRGIKAGTDPAQTNDVPELTGLLYDLEFVGYTYDDAGTRKWKAMPKPTGTPATDNAAMFLASAAGNVVYMAPLGRNAVPAASGGPGGTSGGGGVLEIYSDNANNAEMIVNMEGGTAPQPSAWGEGAGGVAGRDTLVGFTDGTLDIQAVFMPLATINTNAPFGLQPYKTDDDLGLIPSGLNLVWMEDIEVNPWQAGTAQWGDAYGFMEVVDGLSQGAVVPGARFGGCDFDIHADLALTFDENLPSPGGYTLGGTALDRWDNASLDPAKYVAQPEPASLLVWALMGLGSAGYGIRKRRQMRKS